MFDLFKSIIERLTHPKAEARVHILVRGERLIKGGYAGNAEQQVYQHHLKGWIKQSEYLVEFDLEGKRKTLDALVQAIQTVPIWSRVDKMEVSWNAEIKGFTTFRRRI